MRRAGLAAALSLGGALACSLIPAACRDRDRAAGEPPAELRIVSFSPAISRTLVDLGLEDRIVGRSRFCDFLSPSVPVAGDLYAVDYERLIELAPTHLLLQAPATGVDRGLSELATDKGWTLRAWVGIDSIDDIEAFVLDVAGILAAADPAAGAVLVRRAANLLDEIERGLRPPGAGAAAIFAGPTMLVYGTQPVSVFGRDTYLDEILTRLGGTNAVAAAGWIELTLEDVAHLDPAAIVIVRPGAEPTGDAPDPALARAGALATLDVRAVRDGRVALLTHPDGTRPCTGIIGVARELTAVLQRIERGGGDR